MHARTNAHACACKNPGAHTRAHTYTHTASRR
jgi:hypothetical protein